MDSTLRAIADPTRLRIVELVSSTPLSAGSIADQFDISRPAVSQHIAVLRDAGVLDETRVGTRRLYAARLDALSAARFAVDQMWSQRLAALVGATRAEAETVTVERAIVVPASPDDVWALLTRADRATEWMGVSAHIDPRVGGEYRVEVVPGQWAVGTVLECAAPRRFAHTWGWEGAGGAVVPPGTSVVVHNLLPSGTSTVLHVAHTHLPTTASAGSHSRGWSHYLPRLATAATGDAPGADPWAQDPELLIDELRPPSQP